MTVPRGPHFFIKLDGWGNPDSPLFSSFFFFSSPSLLSHQQGPSCGLTGSLGHSTHGIFHGTIRNSTRVNARPTAPEIRLNWHRRASGAAVGREKKAVRLSNLPPPLCLTVSP